MAVFIGQRNLDLLECNFASSPKMLAGSIRESGEQIALRCIAKLGIEIGCSFGRIAVNRISGINANSFSFRPTHTPVIHVISWAEALGYFSGGIYGVGFVGCHFSVDGGFEGDHMWLEGKVLGALEVELWRKVLGMHGIVDD